MQTDYRFFMGALVIEVSKIANVRSSRSLYFESTVAVHPLEFPREHEMMLALEAILRSSCTSASTNPHALLLF